jgi:hypothetical protein
MYTSIAIGVLSAWSIHDMEFSSHYNDVFAFPGTLASRMFPACRVVVVQVQEVTLARDTWSFTFALLVRHVALMVMFNCRTASMNGTNSWK